MATLEELEKRIAELEQKQLIQMTVTNEHGKTPSNLMGEVYLKTMTVKRKVKVKKEDGTEGWEYPNKTVKDPFTFYAIEAVVPENTKDPVDEKGNVILPGHEVRIVMPLGGIESGIFRQPQVGEKVLISKTADGYFLFGFIPTFTYTPGEEESKDVYTFFPDKKKDIDVSKGHVFRYKNTGENYTEYPYSEIGFYTKKYKRTIKETKKKEEEELGTFFMDELDICSTGDINNFASEGYSISAETFELGIGGEKNKNASISIDDEGNITIKAISSIEFSVGNTSMSIDSDGFSVKSKLINTPLENTYDASMSLKALRGFSASGLNCSLAAVKKASINDAMGGSISTNMGMGKIVGREIAIKTYNSVEYNWLALFNTYDFLANTIAYGCLDRDEKKGEDAKAVVQYVLKWTKFFRDLAKDAHELIDEYRELKEKEYKSKEAENKAVKEQQDADLEAKKDAVRKADQANKDKSVQEKIKEYEDKNPGATAQQIAQRRKEYEENYDRDFDQRTFDANWIQSNPQISSEDALKLVEKAEKDAWKDRQDAARTARKFQTFLDETKEAWER